MSSVLFSTSFNIIYNLLNDILNERLRSRIQRTEGLRGMLSKHYLLNFSKITLYSILFMSSFVFASLTDPRYILAADLTSQTNMNTNSVGQMNDLNNEITIDKDNFETYFQRSSRTSYDPQNGAILLYPLNNRYMTADGKFDYRPGINDGADNPALAGSVYLNKNLIDMKNDFSLNGSISIKPDFRRKASLKNTGITDEGDNSYQYGDGFSFAFRPADSAPVGVSGMGLGMTGIPHAFGVALDFYHNKVYANKANGGELLLSDQSVPNVGFAYTQNIPGFYDKVGYTIGDGIDISGSDLDWMTRFDTQGEHSLGYSDLTKDGNVEKMPFKLTWDAKNNALHYNFQDANQHQYEGTKVFSDRPDLTNFAIAGSGNAAQAEYRINIDKIQYAAYGIVNAQYLYQNNENDQPVEIPGVPAHQTSGSLNDNAKISSKLTDVVSSDATESQKQSLSEYHLWKVEGFPTKNLKDYYTLPFSGGVAQLPFSDVTQNVKLYYRKDSLLSVVINYVDENGKKIADPETIQGSFNTEKDIPVKVINGYSPDTSNPKTVRFGTLGSDGKVITQIDLKYHQNSGGASSSSSGSSSASSSSAYPGTSESINGSSSLTTSSASSSSIDVSDLPKYAAKENAAVYALKNIYLYRNADFNSKERLAKYVKKPRIYRPMFVVTGYARSTTGRLRYEVRDVNHLSKTAGKKGYITANWNYVRPVYYAKKQSIITVINPRGVRAYRNAKLAGRSAHFRQGSRLHVKQIVKHNLTTRFILTNGKYITANRKLVKIGKRKQVRLVKTKRMINRYSNENLTKKNLHIVKNKRLKVYGFDYSHGNNMGKSGVLRYRIADGYITGNARYIYIYK